MSGSALGCGRGWFAVFPDCAAASVATEAVIGQGGQKVVAHASGRPWIVGHWATGEVTVAEAGPVRLAVINDCQPSIERVTVLTDRVGRVEDLDWDVLAGVIGADVDVEALAVRLSEPSVPHPVAEQSVWRGVQAVPAVAFCC